MKSKAKRTHFMLNYLGTITKSLLILMFGLTVNIQLSAQQPSGCMLDTNDANPPGILDCTGRLGWCLEPSLNFCNNVKHTYDIAPGPPPTTGMVSNECATGYIMWLAEYADNADNTYTEDEMQQAIWAIQDPINYPAAAGPIADLVLEAENYCANSSCSTTGLNVSLVDDGSCGFAEIAFTSCAPFIEVINGGLLSVSPCDVFPSGIYTYTNFDNFFTNSAGNIVLTNPNYPSTMDWNLCVFYAGSSCSGFSPGQELCINSIDNTGGEIWVWNDQDANDPDVPGCQYIGGLPEPVCTSIDMYNAASTCDISKIEFNGSGPICIQENSNDTIKFPITISNVPSLCETSTSGSCDLASFSLRFNAVGVGMSFDWFNNDISFVSGTVTTPDPGLTVSGTMVKNGPYLEGLSISGFTSTGGDLGTGDYTLNVCLVFNGSPQSGPGSFQSWLENVVFYIDSGDQSFVKYCEEGDWTANLFPWEVKEPGCSISDAGLDNIACVDQGTSTVSTDDEIVFDLWPTGTTLSSLGYEVSASSGTITPTSGNYGAPTAFQLGMGSAGMGDVTITITDLEDMSCTLDVVVTDPGTCSNPSCNLVPTVTNITCNDNGSTTDATDDKILFDLEVTGATGSYGVSTSNGMGITPTSGNYGSVVSYEIASGSAGGGDITITITDGTDMTCTTTVVVTDPGTCSTGGGCMINTPSGTVTCDNNGTTSDATDDKIVYTINLMGSGVASTYNVSSSAGTLTPSSGSYNTSTMFMLPAGSAGSTGAFSITFTDVNDPTCSQTVDLSDPGTCSNGGTDCEITDDGIRMIMCNDGGTPDDDSDDFVTFVLEPTANNASAGYNLVVNGTTVTPTSGLYGVGTTFTLPAGSVVGASSYSYTITDSEKPGCLLNGSFNTPTCSTQKCQLEVSVTDILCNDNGTTTDATDDYLTYTINTNQPDLNGTGFTVSVSSGTVTPNTGILGTPLSVTMQDGSAGSGDVTITITSDAKPDCFETAIVTDPGSCSDVQECTITSAEITNVKCNDGGTNTDSTDDFITFDIEIFGTNTGSMYSISSDKGTVSPTSGAYGTVVSVTMQAGSAGGGDVMITATDEKDNTCFTTLLVPDPGTCSSTTCSLNIGLGDISCDDNGTSDTNDDIITFTLNPSGTALGTGYNVTVSSGTVTPASGTYGAATTFTMQAGSAGAGNFSVTIEDNATAGCTEGADILDPGPCSMNDPCVLTSDGLNNIVCNSNGTDGDPSDDYITFDLDPNGMQLGTSYTVSVSSGTISPTTATYGSATSFTLQNGSAGAGSVTVTIQDSGSASCTLDVIINDPGSCSSGECTITGLGINGVACNDNATENDITDDIITFNLNVSGTLVGANYTVSVSSGTVSPTTGTYGSNTSFSLQPGSAGAGNIVVTVEDVDGGTQCTLSGTVSDPGICSSEECMVNINLGEISCNSNGTPTNETDDFITFELNPTGAGLGGFYHVTVSGGTVSPSSGIYGGSTSFMLQLGSAGAGDVTVQITDGNDPACISSGTITDPGPCSTVCPPFDPYVICDDGTEQVTLEADPGLTDVIWYNGDDVEVGRGNIYVVDPDSPGLADGLESFYYVARDANGCEGLVCCPIFVETEVCCALIADGFEGDCNNNGSTTDPQDDYFTITISANNDANPDGMYEVYYNGNLIGTSDYGDNITLGSFPNTYFIADGSTSYSLVIQDKDNPSTCSYTYISAPVEPCSDCNIIPEAIPYACNDNGTPLDPTDDYVLIEVSADNAGAGASDMYAVYYDGVVLGMMTYNLDIEIGNNLPRPFVADGVSTFTLVYRDVDDPACMTELEVGPFDPCSDDCEVTVEATVSECFDNGTLTDASDDYFTVALEADVVNGGSNASFEVVIGADLATGLGGTVIATGTYGTPITVGDNTTPPFRPDGVTDYHIIVRNTVNDCFSHIEVGPVAPCALITHEKDITSVAATNVGNNYNVVYTITVKNEGGSAGTYGLIDTPDFDDDIIINSASYSSLHGLSGALTGTGPWTLASNESIAAGGQHVYTLTVNVDLDLYEGSGGGDDTYVGCGLGDPGTPPSAGQGLYNASALDLNDDGDPEEEDDACDDLPFITHDKSIGDVTQVGVHTYDVVYFVEVFNTGGAPGDYDLVDMPDFDDDITILSASFTSTGLGAGIPTGLANQGPWVLADNATINDGDTHVYTLTVRVEIDLEDEGAGSDLGDNDYTACGENGPASCVTDGVITMGGQGSSKDIRTIAVDMANACPGEGLFNMTLLDTNNDGNPEEEDTVCDDLPYIVLDKVANDVTMVPMDPYRYNVTYTIEVCNIGGAVGSYDLIDTPMFDDDIVIESASFTSDAPGAPGSGLTGSGPYNLTDDESLAANECHTYEVSFDIYLDLEADSDVGDDNYLECGENSPGGEAVPFQGLFNQATIDTNNDGEPDDVADDCKDIPRVFDLALIKTTTATGPFNFGDVVTFTIEVRNQGNVPATNVKVVDYLPSGFANVAGNAPTWNYDAASHISNTEIPGTIMPTDSYFLSIDLEVVPTMDYANGWTNYAEIWTHADENGDPIDDIDSTPDADNTNDPGGEPMGDTDNEWDGDGTGPIGTGPADGDEDDHDPEKIEIFDLALKKELVTVNNPYRYGDLLEFKITVCNQGNIGAQDVVISDYLPAGFGYDAANNPGWTGAWPETMTTIPAIAVEACEEVSIFLTIEQTAGGEKDWINYSEIQSAFNSMGDDRTLWDIDSTPDTDNADENDVEPNDPLDNDLDSHDKGGEEDDHDPAGIELLDLALRKLTANQTGPYEYGDVVSFTIELYNQGSIQASDIVVTDYIPCGFTYESSNDALGWSFDSATGYASMTVAGPLVPGANTSVSIDLALTQCLDMDEDSFTNYAEISDYTSDDPDYPDPEDVDSMTDSDEDNDNGGTPDDPNEDDNVDGDKYMDEDEDDHDPERVEIFDLALRKELVTINDPYRYGDKLTFTITVCNQGNVDAANIVVEDYVPAGYSFDFADNPAWGGTVSDPTFAVPGVLVQDECTSFDVVLEIQQTTGGEKDWINYAEIISSTDDNDVVRVDADSEEGTDSSTENDVEPGDDEDNDVESTDKGGEEDDHDPAGIELFDLALKKELVSAGPFMYGDVVEFAITLYNQGSIQASNIEVSDYLPCGLIYESSNDALGWTNAGGLISMTYDGPLAAGESDVVTFSARLKECYDDPETAWTNYAEISDSDSDDPDYPDPEDTDSMTDNDPDNDEGGTPNDPDEDDNVDGDKYAGEDEDDHDPAFVPVYDLAIQKTVDSVGPYVPGDIVDFDIKVYNQGNVTAYDVDITDYLNDGYIFDAGINAGWTAAGGLLTYTIDGPFEPGDTRDLVINLEVQILPTAQHGDWYNETEISSGANEDGEEQEDADSMPDTDPDNDNDLVDGPDDDDIFNGDENDNVIDEHKHDPFNEGDDDEDDNDAVEILVTSELGDYVWKDLNGDGIQDKDEPGIENVVVNLFDCDGNFLETTTTDATGYYLFDLLLPGNYQVQFDISGLPEGCAFTLQNQGDDDAEDSDANLGGWTPCIELGPGEKNHTIDAGVLPLASLGDMVWHDLNADGIMDAGEPGIENVRVEIYDEQGNLVGTDFTDADGKYLFDNLYPGEYFVQFYDPTGFELTPSNEGGNDANDSDVDGSNGAGTTQLIWLDAGEHDPTIDAGFFMCAKLGELVWFDTDKDNVWDDIENGINGMKVEIYKEIAGEFVLYDFVYTGHKPGTPSDDGYWKVCVPPGNYYVRYDAPPYGLVTVRPDQGGDDTRDSDVTDNNGLNTTDIFSLTSGGEKCDLSAGFYAMAVIGDRVWYDENANGVQDLGEPGAEGIQVEIRALDGTMLEQTVTGVDGYYEVDELKAKEYYMQVVPPAGFGFTTPNQGKEVEDSDIDHSNGLNTTSVYSLESGDEIPHVDAGLIQGVLPASWLGFTGENKGTFNHLEWAVANEINVNYYELERSFDGINFEVITKKGAVGQAEYLYDYADHDLSVEGIYYYRVRSVDNNGSEQMTDIITIEVEAVEAGLANSTRLYPNPTTGTFTIEIELTKEVIQLKADMLDATGKKVLSGIMLDENVAPGIHKYVIDGDKLPAGMYEVLLSLDTERFSKKLIKLDNN